VNVGNHPDDIRCVPTCEKPVSKLTVLWVRLLANDSDLFVDQALAVPDGRTRGVSVRGERRGRKIYALERLGGRCSCTGPRVVIGRLNA
jgi:hypothetical protein